MDTDDAANRFTWDHLNTLQLGKFAEYYTKMEMLRCGWDIYTAEVDNKGIDFVVRVKPSRYLDIQVKSLRWPSSKYAFIPKTKIELSRRHYVVLVLFEENAAPYLYAIPSLVWRKPDRVFVERDYKGLSSKPEFGISISNRDRAALENYRLRGVLK
ncbi:hypothetical protein FRZ44_33460 [Hypericibacter terrae]|uniref:DUF4365 domain-containing protein n=1 Tax=Hypericibacter terrae TaxID=2602015 RepID=A0A5J6MKC9_9PROT|nr:DUF4365 domain-containing protein [Hypericibacter terrae]QEX18042.1 hypothetical protein FRZ44_33460 [Hypericibacter terrae]